MINCMRTIGCVDPGDVETKHDQILQQYSAGLPRISRLAEHCVVQEQEVFMLVREFENFEPVTSGEVIAFRDATPVRAEHTGRILLPRLQDQGSDGFFIVIPETDY
jgi:succinylglutamate desuccinylase